jgi:UDP-N-acetylmuramate--alanine ligase
VYRRISHIHFVGIGGIGMCGLAELLHDQGYRISGSDLAEAPTVARLRSLGIEVAIGHDETQVGEADVVVYSSAIRATNPELQAAERRGLPVIPRAEMLAEIMRLKDGIAVAGSHGKTTTTSLIAHVLDSAGLDPTAVIGGRVRSPGASTLRDASRTGIRVGRGDLLVAEADESDGSFLRLAPVIAVITNIDAEHLDHYGSFEALCDAFVEFANCVPFWGLGVLRGDHPTVQALLPRMTRRVTTFGFTPQVDLAASEVEAQAFGMNFEVRQRGEALGRVHLNLPGQHNVANALAAIAVTLELGVPFAVAADALANFAGVERRFEQLGSEAGVQVVDDYGHHPEEVRATLAAARAAHPGRVVVVFQPHRYTRTRDCFDAFATAFGDADTLVMTEIYAAGEDKLPGVDGRSLADAVRAHGHRDVRFEPELAEILRTLPEELEPGDLVLTLGAGDVSSLGPQLLTALRGEGSS